MKAVFLDRDGVLNVDHDFVYRMDQWDWVKGAKEAIHRLKDLGYHLFVVTNQSGIGRGFYTAKDVDFLHRWVNERLDGAIDEFYYCPHVPGDRCDCRKPLPGMILRAIRHHGVDTGTSFLIGDKRRDVEAANAAGILGYLFAENNLDEFLTKVLNEQAK